MVKRGDDAGRTRDHGATAGQFPSQVSLARVPISISESNPTGGNLGENSWDCYPTSSSLPSKWSELLHDFMLASGLRTSTEPSAAKSITLADPTELVCLDSQALVLRFGYLKLLSCRVIPSMIGHSGIGCCHQRTLLSLRHSTTPVALHTFLAQTDRAKHFHGCQLREAPSISPAVRRRQRDPTRSGRTAAPDQRILFNKQDGLALQILLSQWGCSTENAVNMVRHAEDVMQRGSSSYGAAEMLLRTPARDQSSSFES